MTIGFFFGIKLSPNTIFPMNLVQNKEFFTKNAEQTCFAYSSADLELVKFHFRKFAGKAAIFKKITIKSHPGFMNRRAANPPKVLYLRSLMHPPYTLSLWWPSYRKFSQLSYEPGCSHELWCRKCATWLWNKYVLFFLKLYFMHISKDILPLRSLNAIKKCK